MMVELSSETSHSAFNNTATVRPVLERSEIDNDGAEISPLGHFGAGGYPYRRVCQYPCPMVKMVPFDKIVANPGDLKHVMELLRCSYGLDVVILARARYWGEFYSVCQTRRSGIDRRLV